MAKLKEIAADVMDSYYQDFKPDEEFLGLEHFTELCANAYAKLLSDAFTAARQMNKLLDGSSIVELGSDWLQIEQLEVKKTPGNSYWEITLPSRPFYFPFDIMCSGIQNVLSPDGIEVNRIAAQDVWGIKLMPVTGVALYAIVGQQIRFYKWEHGKGKKLEVMYAPAASGDNPDMLINDTLVLPVKTTALQFALAVKDGNVKDMSINGNSNRALQTEVDPTQL